MNDYEWWMAEELETAIADYVSMTGADEAEVREDAHEIPEPDYDRLNYSDDMYNEEADKRTFREEMNRRDQKSQYFATTQF